MVEIKYAEMKGVYKILWLRYIYGVDLTNHCMKSLLGHNDKRVRGYMRYLHDLKLEEARWYYLCGVDQNFIWEKNLHLAFVESSGSEIILVKSKLTVRASTGACLKQETNCLIRVETGGSLTGLPNGELTKRSNRRHYLMITD